MFIIPGHFLLGLWYDTEVTIDVTDVLDTVHISH